MATRKKVVETEKVEPVVEATPVAEIQAVADTIARIRTDAEKEVLARVESVGYDFKNTTILVVVGQTGDEWGVRFQIRITEGEYADHAAARAALTGKEVVGYYSEKGKNGEPIKVRFSHVVI